ncbi:MAG: putative ABC transporter permease [Eggerthella lenta]
MPILSKEDERYGYEPGSFAFWRNLAVYFCVFSVLGHWMEIVYCSFMNVFGIVDADSLVWDDPMYPFLVYGVGVVVCALVLMPLKTALVARRATLVSAGIQFFAVTVVVCMLMELAMGFMLNQPNAAGEYPLWDNSQLPFNILGAWLVNDLALAAWPCCTHGSSTRCARKPSGSSAARDEPWQLSSSSGSSSCAVKFA